jgi:predicted flap endonuclease-1-like 5' DNA nuclease
MVQIAVIFDGMQLQDDFAGIPIWLILLIALLVVIVGLVWFLNEENKEKTQPAATKASDVSKAEIVGVEGEDIVPEEVQADDLTLIEGIGPKLSAVLQQAGISTWAKLAQTDIGELQRILDEAGIAKISDPATWPEQATLAAAGDWDGLEKLQGELKGGRRTC